MNKDIASNVDVALSLHPAARAATGTGTAVDLQGYSSAMAVVNFGTWTDGTHTPSLQHSDDGTTYSDAGTDGALQGTFAAASSTATDRGVQRVGYIGSKRYVRGLLTVSGGTTGALSSFNIVRGHPAVAPLA